MNHIAMVAGEHSGDLLASRIIQGLRLQQHELQVMGIGGPAMQMQHMDIRYPMDVLSVFGYVDAIRQLPRLYYTFKGIKKQILAVKPKVFVGVDAPDFNLRLEQQLHNANIPTVHFVSPSIWAWRYERVHKIRQAVDHMLVLFPFEKDIYDKEGIAATYVGHPTASQIPFNASVKEARDKLNLHHGSKVLAILPGSRSSEIKHLAPVFLQTAQFLSKHNPDLQFIVPLVNEERKQQFLAIAKHHPVTNLRLISKSHSEQPVSWDVIQACDAALVASGTASLETALFNKPMVISYILSPMMRKLMEWRSGLKEPLVSWVGLPNILLKEFAVPELLQENARPELLAAACIKALEDQNYRSQLQQKFDQLHHELALDTPKLAAQIILKVAGLTA